MDSVQLTEARERIPRRADDPAREARPSIVRIVGARESYAEQTIRRYGLEYEIRDVLLCDIDWALSADNHARRGASSGKSGLDIARIQNFCTATLAGDVFPMPVLEAARTSGRTRYCILGGVHRCHAFKNAKAESVRCYVVSIVDDTMRDDFAASLTPDRVPENSQDRLENAMRAVSRGESVEIVSGNFSISADRIRGAMQVRRTREELERASINTKHLTSSHIEKLRRVPNDNVRNALARLVWRGMISSDSVAKMVVRLKGPKTEKDQLALVAAIGEEESLTPDGKPEPNRVIRSTTVQQHEREMRALCTRLEILLAKHATAKVLYPKKGARDAFRERILALTKRLTAFVQ